jgi:hypothetical protein
MSSTQPLYLFLNTVQAAGADVVVSEGLATVGDSTNISPSMRVPLISDIALKTGAAAVARVQTALIAGAPATAGTAYSLQVTQLLGSQWTTVYASYVTVTGDTAIIVAGKIASVLTKLIGSGSIELATAANGGTDTITLTGSAGNPLFVTVALEGTITVATTTAGNEAAGVGSDLIAAGITGVDAQPVAATVYSLALFTYGNPVNSGNTIVRNQDGILYVYYDSGSANAAAFITSGIAAKLTTITSATNAGLAVSVPQD